MKKILLWTCILCMCGCAHLSTSSSKATRASGAGAYPTAYQKSTAYDFPDIPIPPELKLDIKCSLVFESASIKAGVLVYRARVKPLSLFNFFAKKMGENGWSLRSYFKYGKFIALFSKPHKDCVIRILDKGFTTETSIWVIPRISTSPAGESSTGEEIIRP